MLINVKDLVNGDVTEHGTVVGMDDESSEEGVIVWFTSPSGFIERELTFDEDDLVDIE